MSTKHMSMIRALIERAQPGTIHAAVRAHIQRGERIHQLIAERWGPQHPRNWKMKHVRWYLQTETAHLAPSTRHDHWRTIRILLAAVGRWPVWEPQLRGPWCYRTGQPGTGGPGGRPLKLPHRRS